MRLVTYPAAAARRKEPICRTVGPIFAPSFAHRRVAASCWAKRTTKSLQQASEKEYATLAPPAVCACCPDKSPCAVPRALSQQGNFVGATNETPTLKRSLDLACWRGGRGWLLSALVAALSWNRRQTASAMCEGSPKSRAATVGSAARHPWVGKVRRARRAVTIPTSRRTEGR